LNEELWKRQALEVAESAVERYGLQDARFGLIRVAKSKQLFFVSSRQGKYVLRIHDPHPTRNEKVIGKHLGGELRSQAAVDSQMHWLADLRHETRLPVPEPIPMLDGSLAGSATVEGEPLPRSFALLRWIPGNVKDDFTLSDAYSLGSYIATMHRHAERYSVPEGFVRPRWDADLLLGGSAPQWSSVGEAIFPEKQMEVLASAEERIRRHLRAVGQSRDVFGIIHSDLNPKNFIFHGEVMYPIDFDECGWGYYLYDLVMPYTFLERYKERGSRMQDALLEGYQLVRPLPQNHLESLDTFASLRFMARMHKLFTNLRDVPLGEVTSQPKWELVRVLMKKLERLSAKGDPAL
jgi:Ser/Thr protein kinase RdoA (MazF antagonist)